MKNKEKRPGIAIKIILYIIAFIILAVGFWGRFSGIDSVLIVAFFSFALVMFINNLDRISEIKATSRGIEAKTRELIKEAEFTIEELRNLVKIITKTEISLVMHTGRMGPYPDNEIESYKKSIENILEKLDISEEEQEDIMEDYMKYTVFDYVYYILGGAISPSGLSSEQMQAWKNLRNRGLLDSPTPEELREFLNNCECLTDERNELIEDYKYFIKNKKHRRPEVFREFGDNWPAINKS